MTEGAMRYFGLDIHKEYFVAVAVNRELEVVLALKGSRTINWRIGQAGCSELLVCSDLDTLEFARKQVERVEECLQQKSAKDERMPLLIQLPGWPCSAP